jgi:serine/threonine protein kinase
MQTTPFQTIKGYRFLERLGKGAFGELYRAYQPGFEREVAIKILLPEHARHPDFIRNFEREAILVASLDHLHIVPILDFWRDENGAFLVMRWIKGGSLRERIKAGLIENNDIVTLFKQISAALWFAHRAGIVHRDLKPDNILRQRSLESQSVSWLVGSTRVFSIDPGAWGKASRAGLHTHPYCTATVQSALGIRCRADPAWSRYSLVAYE